MFFEFITTKNEPVSININKILYITPYKKGSLIVDVEGMDYYSNEEYTALVQRLNDYACKTYKKCN